MDKKLISEIALRCGDIDFKDFDYIIYENTLLKASRKTARKYELIQRVRDFEVAISIPEGEDEDNYVDKQIKIDVPLDLMSFKAEYKIIINNKEYTKVKVVEVNQYQYVLYRNENQILFNYSPRTKSDNITMFYTADINVDDYDIEELQPVIPSQYEEELQDLATVTQAKLGASKFKGSEKGKGYYALIGLYGQNEDNYNRNLVKDTPWIQVKVWSPL